MPELPEVEFARKLAEAVLVGGVIKSAVVDEDSIVFEKRSADWVQTQLVGRKVVAARRWGKYCWLELDAGLHPIFHLGMTGAFRVAGHRPLKLAAHGSHVDDVWPPRFAKLHLTMEDGAELVFTNARRFGRIMFRADPVAEPPIAKLGFDPLLAMPSRAEFQTMLGRRKGVVKGLLLNQAFAAGVGNWIADELLFQAGIDPRRIASTLSEKESNALHDAMESIIEVAVAVDARKDRFPETWLFHHRWGKQEGSQTSAGDAIEFLELSGCTTAWVPKRQF
jgi:formamidopyrimidine-DNA glycosylase